MEDYIEEKIEEKAAALEETVDEGKTYAEEGKNYVEEGKTYVEGELESAVDETSETVNGETVEGGGESENVTESVPDSTEPPQDSSADAVEPPPPPPVEAAAVEESDVTEVAVESNDGGDEVPASVTETVDAQVEESSGTVAETADESVEVSKEVELPPEQSSGGDVAVASSSVEVAAESTDTTVTAETSVSESQGNPNVISVPRSAAEGTSWRSCCGIFDVLRRRSDSS
ncbi:hypothetical protein ACFE04_019374 [Oxalis oulophora]